MASGPAGRLHFGLCPGDPQVVAGRGVRDVEDDEPALVLERLGRPIPRLGVYARDDPTPDSLPAVFGLIVDDRGSLWVRRNLFFDPDDPALDDVFDAGGPYLGEITLLGRLAIFEIGDDYILGAYPLIWLATACSDPSTRTSGR
jgi:hypothetical protein